MRTHTAVAAFVVLGAPVAGVATTGATADQGDKASNTAVSKPRPEGTINARLISDQPGPTPPGKIAVFTADVKTGDTTFVGFQDPQGLAVASISGPHVPPTSTDFILDPVASPYASYGFSGTGTVHGAWAHRRGGRSGKWHGYFYFSAESGGPRLKSATMQPHAAVLLSGSAKIDQVTITK